MNGALLKIQARKLIQQSQPNIIKVAIIYICITLLFGTLSTYLTGPRLTERDILQVQEHLQNGNVDFAIAYLSNYSPEPSARVVDLRLELVLTIVGLGFTIFLLNSIRMNAPCYGNLLDGFGMPFKIIFLAFLRGIIIALWSLLFFIPGIMAAYSYRLCNYLLIDHPEYSVTDCLRESKRLMYGHRMELFKLDLSFLGWSLLASIPVIGWAVAPWTVPYLSTTYALYYEQLCGRSIDFDNRGYDGGNYKDQNWI